MEGRDLERRLEMGRLLDFYEPLITEHRQQLARMYCEEDMTMAEIAQVMTDADKPVTRQGVYDALVKTERQLTDYEKKLGLMERYDRLTAEAKNCLTALDEGRTDDMRAALERMIEL